ncbi:MAG TPA: hypothetical protein VEC56_01325 [Candidatus Krumholzibacteria bacterium]|nr:hypothetical protein [Candidatus Krumholzibacteria bacterium]
MTARRLVLILLAPLALFIDQPCDATTAASLSDRLRVDGDLSDWAGDEWVLDATTALPERDDDSRWGPSEEIVRVGVTWDATYLYLAVEFRASAASLFAALAYGPGGLASLDGAGTFRRAIDFPFALNIAALVPIRDEIALARVDDRGVLVLLDRALAPAVVRAPPGQPAVFEAALPWSQLSLARPLELAVALTGEAGTGAGDAAPDPSSALPVSPGPWSKTRAPLDRWLSIPADADTDGGADLGVSPRAAVTVRTDESPTRSRADGLEVETRVVPGVFAPDRGQEATLEVAIEGDTVDEVFATARVYSVGGALVRVLYEDAPRAVAGGALVPSPQDRWDGRDAVGRIVPGGVYVVAFEWGLVRGERAGRKSAGVAVAR